MFRRYPYWGWLLLCVLLWSIDGYYYYVHRLETQPEQMAAAVTADLKSKNAGFNQLLNAPTLVRHMFSDSLSLEEVRLISDMPFYVFAFENNQLQFWNTNAIVPELTEQRSNTPSLIRNEKGVFIQRHLKLDNSDKVVVALLPVFINYPVENNYLKPHFAASSLIPVNTKIVSKGLGEDNEYAVSLGSKTPLFYLSFNLQDMQRWVPNILFLILLTAALLASISWIHLMIIYLTRNKSSLVGFTITLLVIVGIRTYFFAFGPPFNLDTLLFFSPRLYASSVWLPSFGELFITTLCILWLVVFVTRHTPYKTYFEKIKSSSVRKWVPPVLAAGMVMYLLLFVTLIRSLILDSSISFDVSRFYSINVYTILGLLVICTITGISCMIINMFNFQLRQLIPNKRRKYALVVLMGIIAMLLTGYYNIGFYWCIIGWLVIFLLLLDIPRLTLVSDLFEPQMIFWALFIGLFCTGIVQYFNVYKEKEARKAFVEQRLAPNRDNLLEYTFDKTAVNIERDKTLKEFFYKPSAATRRSVNKVFDTMYLAAANARYEADVYLYSNNGRPLYNKEPLAFDAISAQKRNAEPTGSPYLFYKEAMPDKSSYLSYIPIYSDTINNIIGYVYIDMSLKRQAAETVYPELLLPANNAANPQENDYSYAIYINGRLVSQVKDYPFATYLGTDTLAEQDFLFHTVNNTSELHYRVSDKRTIVVVHDYNLLLETITVFSYIFSIQVALAIFILLYQLYLSYFARSTFSTKYVRLTLRKRIQYAMLSIVFISFTFIGIVTIWYFSSRYRASNTAKLQSSMLSARQSVQGYLNAARAYQTDARFDSVTQSTAFRKFISVIAANQKIDINLFDNNGNLFATSQDEIYQKGLIARIMRPDAFYQLSISGKSIVVQNEHVAALPYLSAYEPMLDERGIALGYLNIPFFSSEKDLKFQISNIVITLINVYAFIFLVSSLITVWITRWVTGSFNMIIQQFGRINLQKNERISWPYEDEIGLLVNEYNKMVNKVEENAALLAQSERETAWREMARQVAHEIKNPLTPMKLNIQYLLQAVKNDATNVKELTQRVSESIIEQIDNLTYIASEFSNFAKMPEAKPEELELGELLQSATDLYRNEPDFAVTVSRPNTAVYVYSDHSQLLRMLTNLLENAKQAIPDDREGKIDISMHIDTEHVTIAIADNGHGISEEVGKRLFQPYFTTKSSGTGLGLAMTKKIIEFWKGKIWFESEENIGTTFHVQLPILNKDAN